MHRPIVFADQMMCVMAPRVMGRLMAPRRDPRQGSAKVVMRVPGAVVGPVMPQVTGTWGTWQLV